MQARDGVFLEDLCPKLRARRWRQELHQLTDHRCLYCGAPSESIDHVFPRSRGGLSSDENCVPACLDCNGQKGDSDAFSWYRSQGFYDPRRAMALRAWVQGDLPLARRLLSWTQPQAAGDDRRAPGKLQGRGRMLPAQPQGPAELAAAGTPRLERRPPEVADLAEAAGEDRGRTGPSLVAGRAPRRRGSSGLGEGPMGPAARRGEGRIVAWEGTPGGRRGPREQLSAERPLTPPADPSAVPQPERPPRRRRGPHQTRQAASPLWRWQMAS